MLIINPVPPLTSLYTLEQEVAYACLLYYANVQGFIAGPAFLHLHLATSIFSDDKERAQHELSLCLSFVEPSLAHLKTHRKTFLCGGAGPLAIAAVCYHKLSRSSESLQCIRRLCSMYSEDKREFERLPSELLYGQTGYLYALLFVSSFIPGSIEIGLMEEVGWLL